MDELATLTSWDLRDRPMCGEQLRRRLDGVTGQYIVTQRFQVASRLFGDIALAHSELRCATTADFPTPNELFAEQQHVYRAAANGYLALFGSVEAVALDPPRSRSFPEHGIEFRAPKPLVVELADGATQIRTLQLRSGVPTLNDATIMSFALVWHDTFTASSIEYVVADLLALEVRTAMIDLSELRERAESWFEERLEHVRSVAAESRPVTGADCADCRYIWNCPPHVASRR